MFRWIALIVLLSFPVLAAPGGRGGGGSFGRGGGSGGGFRGGSGRSGGFSGGGYSSGFRGGYSGGFRGGSYGRGGYGYGGRGYGYGGRSYGYGGYGYRGYGYGGLGFGLGLGYGVGYGVGYGLGYGGYPYYGYSSSYGDYPDYSYNYQPTVVYESVPQQPAVVNQYYQQPAQARAAVSTYPARVHQDPPPGRNPQSNLGTLIAFPDGSVQIAVAYWTEGGTLHYVTREKEQKQVAMAGIDRSMTDQLNRERGVEFRP